MKNILLSLFFIICFLSSFSSDLNGDSTSKIPSQGLHSEYFNVSIYLVDNQGVRTNVKGNAMNKEISNDKFHNLSSGEHVFPTSVNDTLPLDLDNLSSNKYDFQFDPLNINGQEVIALLVDNYKNVVTPLSVENTSIIPFSVTLDPLSYNRSRFTVILKKANNPAINFSGTKREKTVELKWKMLEIEKTHYYELERSSTGVEFENIGLVNLTRANSNLGTLNYKDLNPLSGNNYYRLKTISKNGSIAFSKIIHLDMNEGKSIADVYAINTDQSNAVKSDLAGN